MTRVDRKDPLFKTICQNSPIMYLLQIYDHKTGVCPTTLQQIEIACGMTRQGVRTALKKLEKGNFLAISTYSGAVKGERGFRRVSTITLNLEHQIFHKQVSGYLGESEKPLPEKVELTDEYSKEFEEDWLIYRGKMKDKIGNKKEAYLSYKGAVKKYGREKVMRGTIVYVKKCEASNTWKKNGATWWRASKALFMDKELQANHVPEIALWAVKNSPCLGNLLQGGAKIVVKGDPYMAEALLRLKGSDQTLGQTIDRLGDKKFEESFLRSYDISKRATTPRCEIYTQYENEIEWQVGPSIGSRPESENGKSLVGERSS
mgnify:CR=1 FL=1